MDIILYSNTKELSITIYVISYHLIYVIQIYNVAKYVIDFKLEDFFLSWSICICIESWEPENARFAQRNSGPLEPGRSGGHAPPPQIFDRIDNPISTGGADYDHHITTCNPPPRIFRPSYGPVLLSTLVTTKHIVKIYNFNR